MSIRRWCSSCIARHVIPTESDSKATAISSHGQRRLIGSSHLASIVDENTSDEKRQLHNPASASGHTNVIENEGKMLTETKREEWVSRDVEIRPRQKMPIGAERPIEWPFLDGSGSSSNTLSSSGLRSCFVSSSDVTSSSANQPTSSPLVATSGHQTRSPLLPRRLGKGHPRPPPLPSTPPFVPTPLRISLIASTPTLTCTPIHGVSHPTSTSSFWKNWAKAPLYPPTALHSPSLQPSPPSLIPFKSTSFSSPPLPSSLLKPTPRSLLSHLTSDPQLFTVHAGQLLMSYSARLSDQASIRSVISKFSQERVSPAFPAPVGFRLRESKPMSAKALGGNIAMSRRFMPMETLSEPYTPRQFLQRLHFVLRSNVSQSQPISSPSSTPSSSLRLPTTAKKTSVALSNQCSHSVSLEKTLVALRASTPPPTLHDEASALHLHLAYTIEAPDVLLYQFKSLSDARPGRQALHLSILSLLYPKKAPAYPELSKIIPFIMKFAKLYQSTPGRETWRHIAKVATRFNDSQLASMAWVGWHMEDVKMSSRTIIAQEELRRTAAGPLELEKNLLLRALSFRNPQSSLATENSARTAVVDLEHRRISNPLTKTNANEVDKDCIVSATALNELLRFPRHGQDRVRWNRVTKRMMKRGWVRMKTDGSGTLEWVGKKGQNRLGKELWRARKERKKTNDVSGMVEERLIEAKNEE